MAVGAFALSSLVVFSTPGQAEALSVASFGSALAIGVTEAAPAAEAVAVDAVACAATVVCLAATSVVAVGLAAYSTRDTWLPILKGLLGSGNDSKSTAKPTRCLGSNLAVVDTGSAWQATYSYKCASPSEQPGTGNMGLDEILCKGSDGLYSNLTSGPGVYNGKEQTPFGSSTLTGSQTMTFAKPCEAAGKGTTVKARMNAWFSETYSHLWQMVGTWGGSGAVPDAEMTQTSSMQCTKPDGTTFTLTATTTGQGGRVSVPSCQASVPGSVPSKLTVTGGAPGVEDPHGVYNFPSLKSQYPDCFDSTTGAYKNTCRVKVWIGGQPCVNGMAGCYDPDQYLQDNPGTNVQCKFGAYVVTMSDCDPLKHHYGTTPSTQTTTVTDIVPETGDPVFEPPGSRPTPSASPSTNPSTSPSPSTNPSPTPAPTCYDNCTKTPVPKTTPPGDPAATEDNCFAATFSWNPIDWVYVPVKCALSWAFVPKSAPSFSDVGSPLPAGWLPSVGVMSDGSCGPIVMPKLSLGFKNWTVGPTTMLNTCDQPWPTVRSFTYYGLEAVTLVSVVWQGFRAVTSGIGMGVSFSGGGDDE